MVVDREQLLISSAYQISLNNLSGDGLVMKIIAHVKRCTSCFESEVEAREDVELSFY